MTLNPIHASLLVLLVLCCFLAAYIWRTGLKDYLVRLLMAYTLLVGSWAVAMLGATSVTVGMGFSLFCAASLLATFGIPPTALLVALHLRSQGVPSRATVALAYLPALAFLVASLSVPSGGYIGEATPYGIVPVVRPDGLTAQLNVAVTALYIPLTFGIFLATWLKPRNRRARKQSALFLGAAFIGMVSTVVMTRLGMPLQYIPSLYAYVGIIYLAMHRYRLTLGAPSFAKDRLWDHVREELILTDARGAIVSWNAKASSRYGLAPGDTRGLAELFMDDGALAGFLVVDATGEEAALDRKLFRVARKGEELVALTARWINDSFGDKLGCIVLSSGSVPFQTFQTAYGITVREWEVAGLLAMGLEYKEIGERLFVSPFTVKNHVHSVYRKLGVKNRYELVPLLFPQ